MDECAKLQSSGAKSGAQRPKAGAEHIDKMSSSGKTYVRGVEVRDAKLYCTLNDLDALLNICLSSRHVFVQVET